MMPLAEVDPSNLGNIVLGLGVLLNLGISSLAWVRSATGKSGERQIEPTAIAALSAKLDILQDRLGEDNAARGRLEAGVESIAELLNELRSTQRSDIERAHRRIDEISKEVAAHGAGLSAIQRSCAKC